MEGKARCCQNCKAPCAGDFKKIVNLQYSGLVIYVHTKKDEQKKAGASKYADTFILHNTGRNPIKRPDYISELYQFKTKCGQCQSIVQRVRSLLDEIRAIRENEVIGVCEHCKRASLNKSCKRCDFIVSKFISLHKKRNEERQERFKVWLCKVKHLLQAILDGESVCQHRVYKDIEIERILRELKEPLSMREPDIDFFPTLDQEQLNSFQTLTESKKMLEELLAQMKFKSEKRYSSDDRLYPPPPRDMCLCKYLKEGHYGGEISGFDSGKSKESNDTILSGEPIKDLDVYKNLLKRLFDLSKALPQGLYLNRDLIQEIIETLNTAMHQGLSTNITVKLINELRELNKTLTHDLSKDLNKEVIKGLINDLNELLTIGSSKNLNEDLIRLLVDLSDLLTHELSKGMSKEQSHMLSKSIRKDIDQVLSSSTHKDLMQLLSKRIIKEEPKGSPKSPSREILQGSPKGSSRMIRQRATESPSREIRQVSPTSSRREMRLVSPKGSQREIRQGESKSPRKEIPQVSPKSSSREIRQVSARSSSREMLQVAPRSSRREMRHVAPKSSSREMRQVSPKSSSREMRQVSPKSSSREMQQVSPKSSKKDIRQVSPKSSKREIRQGVSKSPSRQMRRVSPKISKREIRQVSPKSSKREIRQGASKSLSREIRQESPEGKKEIHHLPKTQSKSLPIVQSKKSMPALTKAQIKDSTHGLPRGQSKDGTQSKEHSKQGEQDLSKSQSKKSMQGLPKGQSKEGLPKTLTIEDAQSSPKSQSREQDSPKSPLKEITQDVAKDINKEVRQTSSKRQIKQATPSLSKVLLKESLQGVSKKDVTLGKSPIKSKDPTKAPKDITPDSPVVKSKEISEKSSIDTTNPLVQKLVNLNKALSGGVLDKNLIEELTSDINKVLGQRSSDLLNKIIHELTDLCKPVVQGIPKTSNLKLVQDLINGASKALDQGLSKDQDKKTVQGLLNNLNRALTSGAKAEKPKGLKKDISKQISKHLRLRNSSKALISRTRDASNIPQKDGKHESASDDDAVKGKKSIKSKHGEYKSVSDSEGDVHEKGTKTKRSPSKKKSATGRTGSVSEEDIKKKEMKSGKSAAKKASVTLKKTGKKTSSIERMSRKTKLELANKRGKAKYKFEDENGSYDTESKPEKRSPRKKVKTTKEVKIEGKENLPPDDEKTNELTSKSKQKLSAVELRKAKQLSESVLLRLLNSNKVNAEKYKLYKQKMLAREKEMERRRLRELTNKGLPSPKRKKIITPPSTPSEMSESILQCDIKQTDVPKLMIKGDKVMPYHYYKKEKEFEEPIERKPLLFQTEFNFGDDEIVRRKSRYQPGIDYEAMFRDGIVRYKLSNREFIDKGWTILPTKKIMRRMNIYRMQPANPQNGWFERHKHDKELFYDSGHKLADIDLDGRGQWYYRNGTVALDYYDAEESNVGQRYVIYSSGTEMEFGKIKPRTILALFDVLGNGVVYDHYGRVRLKYNQSEGLIVDPKLGPPGKWKWHTLNDPPVLQQVFVNTCLKERDQKLDRVMKHDKGQDATEVVKESHPEMLAIELDNFVKEKASKLMQKFKPFQIRMKAVKLNEQFSLKILDQANIYLLFRDGATSLKLNLGMLLISDEIIDTDTSDMADVSIPYDKHPAKTNSVENIQKILKTVRSGKLRPPSEITVKHSM